MMILLKSEIFCTHQPRKQGFIVITSVVIILVMSLQMRICQKSPFFVVYVLRNMSNFVFSRFDLELEEFGIDVRVLQDVEIIREFNGWTKDWEKELKQKNCPVVEARFLTKYKNISFEYDNGQI